MHREGDPLLPVWSVNPLDWHFMRGRPVAEAMDYLEQGHARGKVVITM
jgi:hypothetical protein